MGIDSDFFFKAELCGLTDNAHDVLSYLFDSGEKPEEFPFKSARWERIGSPFDRKTFLWKEKVGTDLRISAIYCFAEMKNAESQVWEFLEWVAPYIDADYNEFVGYFQDEYADMPTFFCVNNGEVRKLTLEHTEVVGFRFSGLRGHT